MYDTNRAQSILQHYCYTLHLRNFVKPSGAIFGALKGRRYFVVLNNFFNMRTLIDRVFIRHRQPFF